MSDLIDKQMEIQTTNDLPLVELNQPDGIYLKIKEPLSTWSCPLFEEDYDTNVGMCYLKSSSEDQGRCTGLYSEGCYLQKVKVEKKNGRRTHDLIDRELAIFMLWLEPSCTDPLDVLRELRERIMSLPIVEPEQKIGKWNCSDDMSDLISRQAAIDDFQSWIDSLDPDSRLYNASVSLLHRCIVDLKRLPSAQPDNQINLCDSCDYSYPDCPSKNDDVIFGNGIGNDNICACNKYEPSTQPEIMKEYNLKKIYNIYVKIAQAHFVYQPSKPKVITAMPFDWIETQNLLEEYLKDHGADFDALYKEYISENVKDDLLPSAEPEITDEQAIKHLQSTGWMQNHDKQMYEMGLKEKLVDDSGGYDSLIPSAEPEQKKGEWKRTSFYNDTPVCSECHLEGRWDWVFCPNCGADMRGEKRVND